MKTTILLFVFGLFSVAVLHAQIEKGRVQIGGSLGFSHNNYTNTPVTNSQKTTTFNVSPSVGVFYKTNKLYGAFLNYSYNESTDGVPYFFRNYGGGVFFRQYQPVLNKLYLLVDERLSYSYGSNNYNLFRYHSQSVNASVQAGLAYDISKKMQLELLLNNLVSAGYTHFAHSDSYNIGTSLDGFTFSNIAFGFRYYLK